MSHANHVDKFLMSYQNRVAWGKGDHAEAVQEGVRIAFPTLSETEQADMYSKIIDGFETYKKGMAPRKLWLTVLVRNYMMDRAGRNFRSVLGKAPKEEVGKQLQATASGTPVDIDTIQIGAGLLGLDVAALGQNTPFNPAAAVAAAQEKGNV